MDNDELLRLKRLATDALVTYADNEAVYGLVKGLEEVVEACGDYDSIVDKVTALEEENAELDVDVKGLRDDIRDIYRVTKSANSSDVKRLAEIQEICEEADVDLGKIV